MNRTLMDGNMQCKAKSKQSGKRCKRNSVPGREVCAIHGGKTPTGPALPQYKHGRNIQYLPKGMQQKYQEKLADAELVSLQADIAMIDVLEAELYETISEGGITSIFVKLKAAFREYSKLKAEHKYAEAQSMLAVIENIVAEGVDEHGKRLEILTLKESRRKLVESESKRLQIGQHMMTAEQAMAALGALLDIIKTHVKDETTLHSIGTSLKLFVAGQSGGPTHTGGVH